MAEKDQEFVEFVVKQIVDTPDAVSSTRTVDEMGVLITLTVDPKDLGQVIGRQGQTAKALRTLLRVVGAKHQARVNLKIYEPEGTRPNRPPRDMGGNGMGNTSENNMGSMGTTGSADMSANSHMGSSMGGQTNNGSNVSSIDNLDI